MRIISQRWEGCEVNKPKFLTLDNNSERNKGPAVHENGGLLIRKDLKGSSPRCPWNAPELLNGCSLFPCHATPGRLLYLCRGWGNACACRKPKIPAHSSALMIAVENLVLLFQNLSFETFLNPPVLLTCFLLLLD